MKLNKTITVVLKLLANGPKKTSAIAEKTGLTKGRISTVLSGLVDEGLLEKEGWQYRFSKSPQATAVYTLLKKNPALSAENLLVGTELKVLKALTQERTVKEIAADIGKTERTVYKKMETLKSMGLIADLGSGTYTLRKTGPIYEDLLPLLEDKVRIAPTIFDDADSWVAWSGEEEVILKTRSPEKAKEKITKMGWQWKYTSDSSLDRYGIHILPPETTLYVHKKGNGGEYASLEDVIAHMFLENNEKAMEHGKWLILLRQGRVDANRLRQQAKKYGITKKIEGLLYEVKPVMQT